MIATTIRENDTIQVRSWNTPLSSQPDRTVGQARLRHLRMTRGVYHFEGMKGFEYYQITKAFRCAVLERRKSTLGNWKTWMTDDPLHWTAMKTLCDRLPAGRVLAAGLGLGLMAHHLCRREDITKIRIIELSPDVISLISPTLPEDARIEVINANFYGYIQQPEARETDSVLWDLAVGEKHETKNDLISAAIQCAAFLPGVPLYQFGLRTADHIFGMNGAKDEQECTA